MACKTCGKINIKILKEIKKVEKVLKEAVGDSQAGLEAFSLDAAALNNYLNPTVGACYLELTTKIHSIILNNINSRKDYLQDSTTKNEIEKITTKYIGDLFSEDKFTEIANLIKFTPPPELQQKEGGTPSGESGNFLGVRKTFELGSGPIADIGAGPSVRTPGSDQSTGTVGITIPLGRRGETGRVINPLPSQNFEPEKTDNTDNAKAYVAINTFKSLGTVLAEASTHILHIFGLLVPINSFAAAETSIRISRLQLLSKQKKASELTELKKHNGKIKILIEDDRDRGPSWKEKYLPNVFTGGDSDRYSNRVFTETETTKVGLIYNDLANWLNKHDIDSRINSDVQEYVNIIMSSFHERLVPPAKAASWITRNVNNTNNRITPSRPAKVFPAGSEEAARTVYQGAWEIYVNPKNMEWFPRRTRPEVSANPFSEQNHEMIQTWERESGREALHEILNIVGIIDPTGIPDALNAGLYIEDFIRAKEGESKFWPLFGALTSILSAIFPYAGDLVFKGTLRIIKAAASPPGEVLRILIPWVKEAGPAIKNILKRILTNAPESTVQGWRFLIKTVTDILDGKPILWAVQDLPKLLEKTLQERITRWLTMSLPEHLIQTAAGAVFYKIPEIVGWLIKRDIEFIGIFVDSLFGTKTVDEAVEYWAHLPTEEELSICEHNKDHCKIAKGFFQDIKRVIAEIIVKGPAGAAARTELTPVTPVNQTKVNKEPETNVNKKPETNVNKKPEKPKSSGMPTELKEIRISIKDKNKLEEGYKIKLRGGVGEEGFSGIFKGLLGIEFSMPKIRESIGTISDFVKSKPYQKIKELVTKGTQTQDVELFLQQHYDVKGGRRLESETEGLFFDMRESVQQLKKINDFLNHPLYQRLLLEYRRFWVWANEEKLKQKKGFEIRSSNEPQSKDDKRLSHIQYQEE